MRILLLAVAELLPDGVQAHDKVFDLHYTLLRIDLYNRMVDVLRMVFNSSVRNSICGEWSFELIICWRLSWKPRTLASACISELMKQVFP
jgi:hypothetical protein